VIRYALVTIVLMLFAQTLYAGSNHLSMSDFIIVRIENSEYVVDRGYIESVDARREMTIRLVKAVGERPRLLILNAYYPPVGNISTLTELARTVRRNPNIVSLSWGVYQGQVEYSVIGPENTGYVYFELGDDFVVFVTTELVDGNYQIAQDDNGLVAVTWIPLSHLILDKLEIPYESNEILSVPFTDINHIKSISYSVAISNPDELDGKVIIVERGKTTFPEDYGNFDFEINNEKYTQAELIINSLLEMTK
jgi:hypothetical protein